MADEVAANPAPADPMVGQQLGTESALSTYVGPYVTDMVAAKRSGKWTIRVIWDRLLLENPQHNGRLPASPLPCHGPNGGVYSRQLYRYRCGADIHESVPANCTAAAD